MSDVLITGGTVVDGTGGPTYRADVRVRDGLIAEIAPDLTADGEQVVDAGGAYVTPGIIETHTHLDGAMWWDPSLDPLPAYGNTSLVFGNCGNSLAPLSGDQRAEILDLLGFLEDIPVEALDQEPPWTWERWPDYMSTLDAQPTAVNVGGYLGHLSLRTYVMGGAAWERAATDDERTRMAELLDEGLRHGALGLSVNHFDKDRTLRLVPGYFADDAEYGALIDVLARHPGRTLQVITRFNDPEHSGNDARRFARLCGARGVRAQWPGAPSTLIERDHAARMWDLQGELLADGVDFWPSVTFKPLEPFFGFERSIAFQRVPAWNELLNGPADEKLPTLADPVWRDRARADWDARQRAATSRIDRPDELFLAISETGAGPVDISLAAYAEQTGLHISDALAEWVCANGIGSQLVGAPDAFDEQRVVEMLRDPHTLSNINDSGAHLQLFCGAGQNVYLYTHYVRDTGKLSIEEAVHVLTGRTAGFFGLGDRGVIAPGLAGDLAVFALDEIELGAETRAYDVPHGTWRFTRPPAGFRATIVAGTPTWLDGAATGALPGRPL